MGLGETPETENLPYFSQHFGAESTSKSMTMSPKEVSSSTLISPQALVSNRFWFVPYETPSGVLERPSVRLSQLCRRLKKSNPAESRNDFRPEILQNSLSVDKFSTLESNASRIGSQVMNPAFIR